MLFRSLLRSDECGSEPQFPTGDCNLSVPASKSAKERSRSQPPGGWRLRSLLARVGEEVGEGLAVGDTGPVVLGVGLESGVEGEGRGKRFETALSSSSTAISKSMMDCRSIESARSLRSTVRWTSVTPSCTRAAPFDQDVGAAVGVVHPAHLHEGQPHLGHRLPGAGLLRSGSTGDGHLPVADRDAERGALHRSDRDTRVLIRAEGARVDECDVGGVGVVVDDCGGAGVVADHSDLDAVEPWVFELGDGRDRAGGCGSGEIQAMPYASTVGSTCRHADGGSGAPASSCGISTTTPSGPNCQPWYGHTSRPSVTVPWRAEPNDAGIDPEPERSRLSGVRHNTTGVPSSVRAAGAVPTCPEKATGCQHRRSREDRQTSNTPSQGSATGSDEVVTKPHSDTGATPAASSLRPTETQARRSILSSCGEVR